jgi:hypothetical protein
VIAMVGRGPVRGPSHPCKWCNLSYGRQDFAVSVQPGRTVHWAVLLIIRRSWVRAPPAPLLVSCIRVRNNRTTGGRTSGGIRPYSGVIQMVIDARRAPATLGSDDPLWQQIQSVHVLGADDGEVAPIQAGYVGQIQPFGDRDDGRVYGTQREVGVGANEFGGSRQIGSGDGDMLELTCYNRLQESGLDVGAFFYQPADLDDYCGRDQKRAAKGLQESGTACMVLVRAVDGRNERAGVEKRVTPSALYALG